MLALWEFVCNNPLIVALLLYLLYKRYKSRQPWPDYGGVVTSVHSLAEWTALKEESSSASKLLVVDCYATWCPPCKAAAGPYARMSEEFGSCIFSKVNVDEARDVARELNVTAMPTFKLFRGDSELAACQGWREQHLRELLAKHAPVPSKEDDAAHDLAGFADAD
uniref:Thioredoxin domain-containing protein n=1 Tax=Calcidiscus leptoporus TaxID=127549 RepID=A0A7S0IYA5_9EUKA